MYIVYLTHTWNIKHHWLKWMCVLMYIVTCMQTLARSFNHPKMHARPGGTYLYPTLAAQLVVTGCPLCSPAILALCSIFLRFAFSSFKLFTSASAACTRLEHTHTHTQWVNIYLHV